MNETTANKLPFIIAEAKVLDADFIGLQEVRRPGEGEHVRDGYTLYSMGEKEKKRSGVGILMKNNLVKDIIHVARKSSRIIAMWGKFHGMKMAILSVYAPTEHYDMDVKEEFYAEMDMVIESIPNEYRKNIVILGDFNARIGEYDPIWYNIRGKYGIRSELNENGQLLLDLCARNNLLIANSMFRKKIYGTWKHPRSKKWVTLDYILVSQSSRHLCKNCGINRRIELQSDHIAVELIFQVQSSEHNIRRKNNQKERILKPNYAETHVM